MKKTRLLFAAALLAGSLASGATAANTVVINDIMGIDATSMDMKITQVVSQSADEQKFDIVENALYKDENGIWQVDEDSYTYSNSLNSIVYSVLPDFKTFVSMDSPEYPETEDACMIYYYDYITSDDATGYICTEEGHASDEDTVDKMLKHDLSLFYGDLHYGADEPIAIRITPEAKATSSTVYVNGKQVKFDAYNIMNNNYFKLRDIAMAINGTEKNFDVTWDASKSAINLLSNKGYTVVGGELQIGNAQTQYVPKTNSMIYMNGVQIDPMAYNISGNNYFKLRDLGEIFDFAVEWDSATNSIKIDTSNSYSE